MSDGRRALVLLGTGVISGIAWIAWAFLVLPAALHPAPGAGPANGLLLWAEFAAFGMGVVFLVGESLTRRLLGDAEAAAVRRSSKTGLAPMQLLAGVLLVGIAVRAAPGSPHEVATAALRLAVGLALLRAGVRRLRGR